MEAELNKFEVCTQEQIIEGQTEILKKKTSTFFVKL